MFDWEKFLQARRIPYETRGPNVSRGNLAVSCPYCREEEGSHHMTISLHGRGWACWRDKTHKGKNAARLVQALLKCSRHEANEIVYGKQVQHVDLEDLVTRGRRVLGLDTSGRPSRLELPESFKPLWIPKHGNTMHRAYLEDRGYSEPEVLRLTEEYQMHYSLEQRWKNRIIIPIWDQNHRLISWTARSISSRAVIRYMTLNRDESVKSLSETLFNIHRLQEAEGTLVICEGIFDALRISWFGKPMNVHGTALFTLIASKTQQSLIKQLSRRFQRTVILFDHNAEINAIQLQLQLSQVGAEDFELFPGVKDPGELRGSQALRLCRQLTC